MKRLLIFLLLSLCTAAGAQNSFSCNFKLFDSRSGDAPVMSGIAYVQGNCYRVESADGYVVGDGKSRWVYNSRSEEMVIQADDPSIFRKLTFAKSSDGKATVTYSVFTAELTKVKAVDKLPEVFFRVDTSTLGKNVVITDLRD